MISDDSDISDQSVEQPATSNTATINANNIVNRIIDSKRFLHFLHASGNYPDPTIIGYNHPDYDYNLRPGIFPVTHDQNIEIEPTKKEDMRPYKKRPFACPQNDNMEAENSEDSDKHQASSPPAIENGENSGGKVAKDNKEGEVRIKKQRIRKTSRRAYRHSKIAIHTPKEFTTMKNEKLKNSIMMKKPEQQPREAVQQPREAVQQPREEVRQPQEASVPVSISKESITEDIVKTLAGQKQAIVNGSKIDADKEESNNNHQNIMNNNIGKHHLPAMVLPSTTPRRKSMEIKSLAKNSDEKTVAAKTTVDMPLLQTENGFSSKSPTEQNIAIDQNEQTLEEHTQNENEASEAETVDNVLHEPPEDNYSPEPENLSLKRRRCSSVSPVDLSKKPVSKAPVIAGEKVGGKDNFGPLAQSVIDNYISIIPQQSTVTAPSELINEEPNSNSVVLRPNQMVDPRILSRIPLPESSVNLLLKHHRCLHKNLKEPFDFNVDGLVTISHSYLELERMLSQLPDEEKPVLEEILSTSIRFLDKQLKKLDENVHTLSIIKVLGQDGVNQKKAIVASTLNAIIREKILRTNTTFSFDLLGSDINLLVPAQAIEMMKNQTSFQMPNDNNTRNSTPEHVPPGSPPPNQTQPNKKNKPRKPVGRPRSKSNRNIAEKQMQQLTRSFSSPHTYLPAEEMPLANSMAQRRSNESEILTNNNVPYTQTSSVNLHRLHEMGDGSNAMFINSYVPQVSNMPQLSNHNENHQNNVQMANQLLSPGQRPLPHQVSDSTAQVANQALAHRLQMMNGNASHMGPPLPYNIPQLPLPHNGLIAENAIHPSLPQINGQTSRDQRPFQIPPNGSNKNATNQIVRMPHKSNGNANHQRVLLPYNVPGMDNRALQDGGTFQIPYNESNGYAKQQNGNVRQMGNQTLQERRPFQITNNESNEYANPQNGNVPQVGNQTLQEQRLFQIPHSKSNEYANHQNNNVPQVGYQTLQNRMPIQISRNELNQNTKPQNSSSPNNNVTQMGNRIIIDRMPSQIIHHDPMRNQSLQDRRPPQIPHNGSNEYARPVLLHNYVPHTSPQVSTPQRPNSSANVMPAESANRQRSFLPTNMSQLYTPSDIPNMPESARHHPYPQNAMLENARHHNNIPRMPLPVPRMSNPNQMPDNQGRLTAPNNFPQNGNYLIRPHLSKSLQENPTLLQALQNKAPSTKVSGDVRKTPEAATADAVPSGMQQQVNIPPAVQTAHRSRRKDSHPKRVKSMPVVISTDTSMQITMEPTDAPSDDNKDLSEENDQLRMTVIQNGNDPPADVEATPIKTDVEPIPIKTEVDAITIKKELDEEHPEFQVWLEKLKTDHKLKNTFLKQMGIPNVARVIDYIEISDSDDDEHCEVQTPIKIESTTTTQEKKSVSPAPDDNVATPIPDKQPTKLSLSDLPVRISVPYSPEIEPISPVNNASPVFTYPEVPNVPKEAVSAIKQKTLLTFGDFHTSYSHKFPLSDNKGLLKDPPDIEELIPDGKLRYMPEKHAFLRYHDYAQAEMFLKSLECDEEFLTPADVNAIRKAYKKVLDTGLRKIKQTELITLPDHIEFTEMECLEDVEKYIVERQLVDSHVPGDFSRFYAYVTGFQIINKNPPISLRTFLTMYNTNRLMDLMRKYLIEKGCGSNNLVVNNIIPTINQSIN